MLRRISLLCSAAMLSGLFCLIAPEAVAQGPAITGAYAQQQNTRAFGRTWGGAYKMHDYERFYHYPYVYYPQNFYGSEYYQSSDDLYHRYPQEMRIPVYNRHWHNYYPEGRDRGDRTQPLHRYQRYHHGHHFILDVF